MTVSRAEHKLSPRHCHERASACRPAAAPSAAPSPTALLLLPPAAAAASSLDAIASRLRPSGCRRRASVAPAARGPPVDLDGQPERCSGEQATAMVASLAAACAQAGTGREASRGTPSRTRCVRPPVRYLYRVGCANRRTKTYSAESGEMQSRYWTVQDWIHRRPRGGSMPVEPARRLLCTHGLHKPVLSSNHDSALALAPLAGLALALS